MNKRVKIMAAVLTIGLAMLAGCKKEEPTAGDKQDTAKGAAVENMKEQMANAKTKEAAFEEAEKQLQAMTAGAEALQQEAAAEKPEVKTTFEDFGRSLDEKIAAAKVKLVAVKTAGAQAWQASQSEVTEAMAKAKEVYAKARDYVVQQQAKAVEESAIQLQKMEVQMESLKVQAEAKSQAMAEKYAALKADFEIKAAAAKDKMAQYKEAGLESWQASKEAMTKALDEAKKVYETTKQNLDIEDANEPKE